MLGIDLQQIFLHLLNFGILFFGLYFILFTPVKNFMDKRVQYYKSMDDEAKEKLDQAEAAKKEYEDNLSQFKTELNEKRAEAAKELNAYRDAQTQAANDRAKEIILEAKNEAVKERTRIVNQSSAELTDLAVKAAKKVVDESISESYDRFLEAAEKELLNEQ